MAIAAPAPFGAIPQQVDTHALCGVSWLAANEAAMPMAAFTGHVRPKDRSQYAFSHPAFLLRLRAGQHFITKCELLIVHPKHFHVALHFKPGHSVHQLAPIHKGLFEHAEFMALHAALIQGAHVPGVDQQLLFMGNGLFCAFAHVGQF